ncbi:hypothetical protein GEU84_017600 [Fertoebacter nigrum]|uniref:Uncharacterized protein n=1 Tax=Fertoeibacter niger TaxID=2656921 RepID=A0A8X8H2Q8_9RHOB|nr:hypothetical protein [Fertoeibacter niger]NUB46211.1 hypothetical protein [Fertoeibacter niger]
MNVSLNRSRTHLASCLRSCGVESSQPYPVSAQHVPDRSAMTHNRGLANKLVHLSSLVVLGILLLGRQTLMVFEHACPEAGRPPLIRAGHRDTRQKYRSCCPKTDQSAVSTPPKPWIRQALTLPIAAWLGFWCSGTVGWSAMKASLVALMILLSPSLAVAQQAGLSQEAVPGDLPLFARLYDDRGARMTVQAFCELTGRITAANEGLVTTASMVHPDQALNEGFCRVLRGVTEPWTEGPPISMRVEDPGLIACYSVIDGVIPILLDQPAEQILGPGSSWTKAIPDKLAERYAYCLAHALNEDDDDRALYFAVLLVVGQKLGYAELVGHALALGLGTAPDLDAAAAWYEGPVFDLPAMSAAEQAERRELNRLALAAMRDNRDFDKAMQALPTDRAVSFIEEWARAMNTLDIALTYRDTGMTAKYRAELSGVIARAVTESITGKIEAPPPHAEEPAQPKKATSGIRWGMTTSELQALFDGGYLYDNRIRFQFSTPGLREAIGIDPMLISVSYVPEVFFHFDSSTGLKKISIRSDLVPVSVGDQVAPSLDLFGEALGNLVGVFGEATVDDNPSAEPIDRLIWSCLAAEDCKAPISIWTSSSIQVSFSLYAEKMFPRETSTYLADKIRPFLKLRIEPAR